MVIMQIQILVVCNVPMGVHITMLLVTSTKDECIPTHLNINILNLNLNWYEKKEIVCIFIISIIIMYSGMSSGRLRSSYWL